MEGKEKRKKPPRRTNTDKDSCMNCDECGVKVNPDASTTRKCLLHLGILFCSKECKTKSKHSQCVNDEIKEKMKPSKELKAGVRKAWTRTFKDFTFEELLELEDYRAGVVVALSLMPDFGNRLEVDFGVKCVPKKYADMPYNQKLEMVI